MNLTLEGLDLQIDVIQLCVAFTSLPEWYQQSFLQYLQDEYAGIDDEFDSIISSIISSFYQWVKSTTPNTKRCTIRNILGRATEFDSTLPDEDYTVLHLCEDLEAHLSVALERFSKEQSKQVQMVLQSMTQYARDEIDTFKDEHNLCLVRDCEDDDHDMDIDDILSKWQQDEKEDTSSLSQSMITFASSLTSNTQREESSSSSSSSSMSSYDQEDIRNRHVY